MSTAYTYTHTLYVKGKKRPSNNGVRGKKKQKQYCDGLNEISTINLGHLIVTPQMEAVWRGIVGMGLLDKLYLLGLLAMRFQNTYAISS